MNFVDKYIQLAAPLTEAPKEMHRYMAYLMLSYAIGKNIYYSGAGPDRISPLLWFILVGSSTLTKKTTTLNLALNHILIPAFPNRQITYPDDGSREGLITAMKENPRGIIRHSEFSNFMDWLTRDYNSGLLGLLTAFFDQPLSHRKKLKGEDIVIIEPYINIVACTTINWMEDGLTESRIKGGFLGRFNVISPDKEQRLLPRTPPIDENLKNELVSDLQQLEMDTQSWGQIHYDPQAEQMVDEWYIDFHRRYITEDRASLIPLLSRKTTEIHKFAMINCAIRHIGQQLSQPPLMSVDDASQAMVTIEAISKDTLEIVGEKLALTPFEKNRRKVLEVIDKHTNGNGYAAHSNVLKYSYMSARQFAEIIGTLAEEKTVEQMFEGEGRKQTTYYKRTKD